MRYQAELGDVDFITGDYLAEVNIAENAQAHAAGTHPGWEQTAWDGIEQTLDLLAEKRIKVVINGGAHNPRGLAEKVQELVSLAQRLWIVADTAEDREQETAPQGCVCAW
jgi:hypothetical protein